MTISTLLIFDHFRLMSKCKWSDWHKLIYHISLGLQIGNSSRLRSSRTFWWVLTRQNISIIFPVSLIHCSLIWNSCQCEGKYGNINASMRKYWGYGNVMLMHVNSLIVLFMRMARFRFHDQIEIEYRCGYTDRQPRYSSLTFELLHVNPECWNYPTSSHSTHIRAYYVLILVGKCGVRHHYSSYMYNVGIRIVHT